MLIFGRHIVALFVSGSQEEVKAVVDIAYQYLSIMATFLAILYMLHVHRSGLMGMGDTVTPMISGIIEMVMRVGTVLLLPKLVGSFGVFFAEVTAWTGAAILLTVMFYVRLHRLRKMEWEMNR